MENTRHQPIHAVNNTDNTEDFEDTENTDMCDRDTDHPNKRRKTASAHKSTANSKNDSCIEPIQHESMHDHDKTDDHNSDKDDTVLSEVHIHPDNGLVDRRTITSTFFFSQSGIDTNEDNSCLSRVENKSDDSDSDKNGDGGCSEDDLDSWDYEIQINHAMGTDLRGVGSQVWMGCFLLVDWIVHMQEQLQGAVVLEIGAGTGLATIATRLLTSVDRIYCTDYDSEILQNCKANIDVSGVSKDIKTRRLNWLMDDPFVTMEDDYSDVFDWSPQERQDWDNNGTFIFAADVVYDDSLTDALVDCLEKLLLKPLPASHPRYYIGRVAYMTMEKRYNFSLDELAVVAQAYEYFKDRMTRSDVLEAEEIDVSTLSRHCDYERTGDLVLFRICCK
ncbi:Methyltransferase-like protein 22 [Linnemannia zychae]|nr:Methyltransferase-like protein 22 [Linnemannia zychae]